MDPSELYDVSAVGSTLVEADGKPCLKSEDIKVVYEAEIDVITVDPSTQHSPGGGGRDADVAWLVYASDEEPKDSPDPLSPSGSDLVIEDLESSTPSSEPSIKRNRKKATKRKKSSSKSSKHSGSKRRKIQSNSRRIISSSSDSDTDSDGGKHQKLKLTERESEEAAKLGIKFPKYLPLNRDQEKKLKKIKRKIRNQQSANESRLRRDQKLTESHETISIRKQELSQLREEAGSLKREVKDLQKRLDELKSKAKRRGTNFDSKKLKYVKNKRKAVEEAYSDLFSHKKPDR